MPAIDQNLFSAWNEQEQNMYNTYPFWLASYSVRHRETFATHSKLVGKRKWTRNMGSTMKGVRKEPSPHLRQEATPQELHKVAKKDIMDVQEMTIETTLKHHKFESRIIPFYPSFNDFLKDHLVATSTDITKKSQRYEDIFCRTAIFHQSPHVFLCNKGDGEVVVGPQWDGKDVAGILTAGKTQAWRQSVVPLVGNPGNLTITNCFLVDSFLREDIRAVPWSDGGSGMPKDNSPMTGKNVLVLSNEAYNQFRFDPFLLDNRRIDLDIVQQGFKGAIGDNITCKIEDLPLRMAADGSFPAPQARELGNVYNRNESILTDAYKNAPYEWAFMYAADGYESLEIGPPPAEFTKDTPPHNFPGMFWNGEVKFTKLFNIPVTDEDDNTTYEFNTYGEHMKAICHLALGIVGTQRRNVVPILFKRIRGV